MSNNLAVELLNPADAQACQKIMKTIIAELDRALLGRHEIHTLIALSLVCRGHVLLEGLPGLGKTALVKRLSEVLTLPNSRVQFTPDLMPGDILGSHILQEGDDGKRHLSFQPGPIFTNILLADEINRASPKTQAAMLEAMQERCVTLRGEVRQLDDPFLVLATQNPIESEGTFPLPEAQLDRFLFKIPVDAVDASVLCEIISTRRQGNPDPVEHHVDRAALDKLFSAMEKIHLPKPVALYIATLVGATHPQAEAAPDEVNAYVKYGASPRAAIGIAEAARAKALANGSPTVGFDDVDCVLPYVLNHRLLLNYRAQLDGVDEFAVIQALNDSVDPTGLGK